MARYIQLKFALNRFLKEGPEAAMLRSELKSKGYKLNSSNPNIRTHDQNLDGTGADYSRELIYSEETYFLHNVQEEMERFNRVYQELAKGNDSQLITLKTAPIAITNDSIRLNATAHVDPMPVLALDAVQSLLLVLNGPDGLKTWELTPNDKERIASGETNILKRIALEWQGQTNYLRLTIHASASRTLIPKGEVRFFTASGVELPALSPQLPAFAAIDLDADFPNATLPLQLRAGGAVLRLTAVRSPENARRYVTPVFVPRFPRDVAGLPDEPPIRPAAAENPALNKGSP